MAAAQLASWRCLRANTQHGRRASTSRQVLPKQQRDSASCWDTTNHVNVYHAHKRQRCASAMLIRGCSLVNRMHCWCEADAHAVMCVVMPRRS